MTERLIIAGSGGQGVMLLGKILAEAGMLENRFVTWLPSYGAEVRGGTSHCMVIISDAPIGSPYVEKADTVIAMNQPSLKKFRPRLSPKGLLVVNGSLIASVGPKNARTLVRPFTDIAIKIGNIRVANTLALGAYLARKKIVRVETVEKVMVERGSKGHQQLVRVNQDALQEGVRIG